MTTAISQSTFNSVFNDKYSKINPNYHVHDWVNFPNNSIMLSSSASLASSIMVAPSAFLMFLSAPDLSKSFIISSSLLP